jgi:VWFA-related protein
MFNRRLSPWIQSAAMAAVLSFAASYALGQEQKLPDAPTPQNNAPAPSVNLPSQGTPDDQGSSSSGANPEAPSNTRSGSQQPFPEPTNPEAPPPGSQGIKTAPASSASNAGESGRDELFRLQRTVSFVTVPVTVKDDEGKLVDGLLLSDFSVYEDGLKQQIKLFTSDPFPLSAALIIDQGMSDLTLKKVNQTFSALGGSFGPFDEVAVFTYGNTVNQRSDFSNASRMEIALQRIKDVRGQEPSAPVVGGPFGSGPVTNGKPMPGTRQVITPEKESHVLNDAILAAAQNLARRPRQNRKIIFVISNGQELGSRASYAQVLKVLLTDEIAVYAIGVDSAAMPIYNKIEKARIPGFGYSDILPRYANATGGDVLNEFSKESIESAYQRITMEARNQYTLGYNTPQKPSSNYREIEVRVRRPGLEMFAKHGYYPLPPQRAEAQPPTADQPATGGDTGTTAPPPQTPPQ